MMTKYVKREAKRASRRLYRENRFGRRRAKRPVEETGKEKAVAEGERDQEEYDSINIVLQQSRHLTAKDEIKHHADERARYLGEAADLESKVKEAEIVLFHWMMNR